MAGLHMRGCGRPGVRRREVYFLRRRMQRCLPELARVQKIHAALIRAPRTYSPPLESVLYLDPFAWTNARQHIPRTEKKKRCMFTRSYYRKFTRLRLRGVMTHRPAWTCRLQLHTPNWQTGMQASGLLTYSG